MQAGLTRRQPRKFTAARQPGRPNIAQRRPLSQAVAQRPRIGPKRVLENSPPSTSESAVEEQANDGETAPEAFSQFLQGLDSAGVSSSRSFGGDSYDALKDSLSSAAKGQGPAKATPTATRHVLDPRVQMVVNSYPPTSIERNYPRVQYPSIKVDKKDYQKGWTSVYFQILTNSDGRIVDINLLRPEKPTEFERVFVEAVRSTVQTWKLDRTKAEVHVDVRFYVE